MKRRPCFVVAFGSTAWLSPAGIRSSDSSSGIARYSAGAAISVAIASAIDQRPNVARLLWSAGLP